MWQGPPCCDENPTFYLVSTTWPKTEKSDLKTETVAYPKQRYNRVTNSLASATKTSCQTANQLKTVIFQITCYDHVNALLLFWNRNDEELTANLCMSCICFFLCNYLHIPVVIVIHWHVHRKYSAYFETQEVYHITCFAAGQCYKSGSTVCTIMSIKYILFDANYGA